MRKRLILMILGIFTFVGCETSTDCGFGDVVSIAIDLNTSEVTTPVTNVHIYGFSASGKFNVHEYFTSKEDLDAYRLSILRDGYTIIAVANVGADFIPMEGTGSAVEAGDLSQLTLTDFIVWLKGIEPQYPDIMTGQGGEPVDQNGILTIIVDLKEGSDLRSTLLRLHINLLDDELPDYDTRVVPNHNPRVVAEVYRAGTVTRIHSNTEILDEYIDLHLAPGEYEIHLWADHTPTGSADDHHYSTSSLRTVQFNDQKEYVAGEDSRKAFAHKLQAVVEDQPITEKHVDMPLALAKYQIIATDVEQYKVFIIANDFPKLEDLLVTVSYEGFMPSSYDVDKTEPNSSDRAITYTTPLKDITNTTAMIGGDYIFANDVDSQVSATITVSDKNTNTVISRVNNVTIDHVRGHLTTVKFDYLTAGVINNGVSIDTRWEGVYDVYF